jgi:hypothetical protein
MKTGEEDYWAELVKQADRQYEQIVLHKGKTHK